MESIYLPKLKTQRVREKPEWPAFQREKERENNVSMKEEIGGESTKKMAFWIRTLEKRKRKRYERHILENIEVVGFGFDVKAEGGVVIRF